MEREHVARPSDDITRRYRSLTEFEFIMQPLEDKLHNLIGPMRRNEIVDLPYEGFGLSFHEGAQSRHPKHAFNAVNLEYQKDAGNDADTVVLRKAAQIGIELGRRSVWQSLLEKCAEKDIDLLATLPRLQGREYFGRPEPLYEDQENPYKPWPPITEVVEVEEVSRPMRDTLDVAYDLSGLDEKTSRTVDGVIEEAVIAGSKRGKELGLISVDEILPTMIELRLGERVLIGLSNSEAEERLRSMIQILSEVAEKEQASNEAPREYEPGEAKAILMRFFEVDPDNLIDLADAEALAEIISSL